MAVLFNRVQVNTATTGTGNITLGAAVDGFQTFAQVGAVTGNVVSYVIEDGAAWEYGRGTYIATGTILQRSVLRSSNANAPINLTGAGIVRITALAEDIPITGASRQVATSGIENDAVTLDKMASGTDGAIITYDASGNPVLVGPGTARQVPTSQGAGLPLVMRSPITALTAQATTSGTAFNFPGIPAGVRRVIVAFNGVSLTGSNAIVVQLGNASVVENTGYNSSSGTRSSGDLASTIGFVVRVGGANNSVSGIMTIVRLTGNTWVSNVAVTIVGTGTTVFGAGRKVMTAELTQVRLTRTGGDSFDTGQVNVMYE